MWSFTFLALWVGVPVVAIATAVIGTRVLGKWLKARKAKKLAKEEARKAVEAEKKPEPEKKPESEKTSETEKEPKKDKISSAEYLRNLNNNMRYFAEDFDMFNANPENYINLINYKVALANKLIDDPKQVEMVKAKVEALNAAYVKEFGRMPEAIPAADACAYVLDEEGRKVYDHRNYCFIGSDNSLFKETVEKQAFDPQEGLIEPIILQINAEGHKPWIVSATHEELYKAGRQTLVKALEDNKVENFTYSIIYTDDANNRKKDSAPCKSSEEFEKAIDIASGITPSAEADDEYSK